MSYQCCGYQSGPQQGYSRLESITYHASSGDYQPSNINYFAEAVAPEPIFYQPQSTKLDIYKNSNQTLYQISKTQPTNVEYTFIPDRFLAPGRIKRFIGDAEQIQEEIKEAFKATTNQEFPPDIQITVCSDYQFKQMIDQPGVRGFSINRKQAGLISEIFVINGDLGSVMLTIGHEIGHVLSFSLEDKRLEEAKAFAFSKAWMKAIKENDIAGLKNAIITENPAQNGVHNVAHTFIHQFKNKDPLELYWEIVRGQHVISCLG